MSEEMAAILAARERLHIVHFDEQDKKDIGRVGDFVNLIFEDEFGHEVMEQECCIMEVDKVNRTYIAVPVGGA